MGITMNYKVNKVTGKLDRVQGYTKEESDAMFLKLDQTIRQYVINGIPQFSAGLEIKKDKPLYHDGV